ncbi:MAG: glycosyltransferase [Bacillota bacterium]
MHILYIHQNFPAQFGHIAKHLVQKLGWRCSFVSQTPPGTVDGIEKIAYKVAGGATRSTHYCSRTFENTVWHCDAVYQALAAQPSIQPDLIVGHSGFGSTLFLRELYGDVPIINLFEYYYRCHDPLSDMDFRKDLGWEVPERNYLRSYCRNAMILLDLQNCDAGYAPTQFQKSRFPTEYASKMEVIFDGVDRSVYQGHQEQFRPPVNQRTSRTIADIQVPADTRIITYVSRGFESMRGFDIFMRSAKLITQEYPNVLFFVVGTDRIAYGGDDAYIQGSKSFKEWVLARDQYDLSKFIFTGRLTPTQLGQLLAASDLHIYLTVPFVLSWSMMDAMSCGAVVLGSRTTPVEEMIQDGQNGLLADFFDPEDFARKAVAVLKDPAAYRPLGRAAEQMIIERYSLDAVLPRMLDLYERTLKAKPRQNRPPVPTARKGGVSANPIHLPASRSPFRG